MGKGKTSAIRTSKVKERTREKLKKSLRLRLSQRRWVKKHQSNAEFVQQQQTRSVNCVLSVSLRIQLGFMTESSKVLGSLFGRSPFIPFLQAPFNLHLGLSVFMFPVLHFDPYDTMPYKKKMKEGGRGGKGQVQTFRNALY